MSVFSIDGVEYNVVVPSGGLKRSFQVLDGDNAGRALSGLMKRDIIGTFYNYELAIETHLLSLKEYDTLYEVLSDPKSDSHVLKMPYGQSTLTFDAYVTAGQDALKLVVDSGQYWEGLVVQFVAMAPQRKRT